MGYFIEVMGDAVHLVLVAIAMIVLALLAYLALAVMPMAFIAERKCLAAGYPKTHVTITLDTYCSTLDGAVKVLVKPI